ncbi:MAG: DUF6164 family protein [Granulosicoccus sp.]
MSALIFRLRHVPQEEADAIRALLDVNGIDWYETSAGNWGIAMPGLWAANPEQVEQASRLIEKYQQDHSASQRKLHEQQRRLGQSPTLLQRLFDHPLRSAGIILFCIFILYVSIHPFLQMIEYSQK